MKEIAKLLELFKSSTGISIDSRKVFEANIFFALKGDQSDGNKYAAAAIERGALCAVIDNPAFEIEGKTMLVENSLHTLQQLASAYRSTLKMPVIGLTGSNGKTTTKELLLAVLQKKFRAFATKGNLNNHIGVPLSILSIMPGHEIAVIEMGANHLGEIEFLCSIAKPTHGLITNIGLAHLEGFGGPEGVKKGKTELFEYIKQNEGIIFANTNEKKLDDVLSGYEQVIEYGYDGDEFIVGKIISDQHLSAGKAGFAVVEIDNAVMISSKLIGSYNADNILAAACVGKYLGVNIDDIKTAIEQYTPDNNRIEFMKIGENYFILDAYNANPSSMKVALENFSKLNAVHKVAILGDMLEMGEYAMEEHQKIVNLVVQSNFDEVIFVGPEFQKVVTAHDRVSTFTDSNSAAAYFNARNFSGVTILLKGSRGIQLERILNN